MTVASATGAPPACARWDAIDWRDIHGKVRRLQVRIAKAVGEDLQQPGRYPATFVRA